MYHLNYTLYVTQSLSCVYIAFPDTYWFLTCFILELRVGNILFPASGHHENIFEPEKSQTLSTLVCWPDAVGRE